MGNVIGIDLGTTNTAVSVVTDGRPRILEDAHGYKVVPSVVWIGDDGSVMSWSLSCGGPDGSTIRSLVEPVKRLAGRPRDGQSSGLRY